MPAKLYVVPASHPCVTVARALEIKGVPFKQVHYVPVFHKLAQRARFGKPTVPGIVFEDGMKLTGSRAIMRELERRVAEPALLPSEPDALARVEDAERWGDEVLQRVARRVIWAALSASPASQLTYLDDAKLVPPTPRPVARASVGAIAWAQRRINQADDETVRADLRDLPGHLDRVDAWIADGVIGIAGAPNVADLQIGSSLRLLQTIGDVAPLIDPRPSGELARRLFPDYPGAVPAGMLSLPAAA